MATRGDQLSLRPLIAALLAVSLATGCPRDVPSPDTGVDAGVDAPHAPVDTGRDVRSDATSDIGTDAGALLRPGCNPIAQEYDCLLPYPSDVFRDADGVRIPEVATPQDKFGAPVLAFDARTADGFSVSPSILFTFGDGIAPDSLLAQADSAASITAQSPTLLLDAASGEAVPHFSEVYLGGGPSVQIGAIRPLVRLGEGRRYVVAVKGARLVDGGPVVPGRVFAALRDGEAAAELADLQARYDAEIFAVLDDFGVDRADLDLAWDFTTRSRDDLMGDMLSVRAGTLAWLDANPPTVMITEVLEGDDLPLAIRGESFRQIEGHFTAPLWTETNEPGARLRGPLGEREIVGTVEVPFTVTIPESIGTDDARRGSFIQYGHGFFGRRDEVISGVQAKFGNDFGFVMGAVDWIGMTREDRDWVVGELTDDPAAAFGFVPRVHQGMSNQLVFTEVVRTLLAAEPSLTVGARLSYIPEQTYFLGISQGHILGGTFMALSPTIERAVLNVGGASFALILTRSYAFLLYARLLAQWIEPLELLKFEALAAEVLEVIDPIAYAPLVLTEPLPGAVPKQILLQGGIGDAAVPTVAMELHARALGIGLVTPSAATVPFMLDAPAPAASGLTLVDFGLPQNIARDWRPVNMDTHAHESVRRLGTIREQMNLFLRPGGQIEDTCNGPCVVP